MKLHPSKAVVAHCRLQQLSISSDAGTPALIWFMRMAKQNLQWRNRGPGMRSGTIKSKGGTYLELEGDRQAVRAATPHL